jgi:beta-lactamase regulating signal transducer with metallopeptidase domain
MAVSMAAFFEAAMRSLLLAVVVWAGLRVFRVRNVVAQKWAWAAVLAGAFIMPVILPFAARWQQLPAATLALPAAWVRGATIAQGAPDLPASQALAVNQTHSALAFADSAAAPESPASGSSRYAAASGPPPPNAASHSSDLSQWNSIRSRISLAGLAASLYLMVAAALLFRLLFGIASTLCLWRGSRPININTDSGPDVRCSSRISSPATIGTGILLPADYSTWSHQKLRIVLAHEGSHIRQGDFYLQLLAALYAALVWFSPLGWWLKHKLYELGETISDRYGLEEAADGSSYAQILLEFAAAPRTAVLGVAMARPSTVSRRIERLLNEQSFRQAFATSRRTLATALLVPVALFAAVTFVRVTATAQAPEHTAPASSQTATMGQSNPEPAPPTVPSDAAPAPAAAPETAPAPDAAPAPPQDQSSPSPAAAPAPPAPSATPEVPAYTVAPRVRVEVPAIQVNGPAQHIEVPAVHVDMQAKHIEIPAQHIDIPARHIDVPAVHVEVPAHQIDIPAKHIDIPARHIDVPAIHIDVPPAAAPSGSDGHAAIDSGGELLATLSGSNGRATNGSGGELLAMLHGFGYALFQSANADSTGLTFDRSLTFSGKLELTIGDGSGNIQIHRGSANQIHIHATVRANHPEDEQDARDIAANPPIEQNGNIIHIGEHDKNHHNVSINYEIEAPADTTLNAATGSGNITDVGVGQDSKLSSGSGNVTATGLEGGFKILTGSGNIAVGDSGEGDAKVQTGSGTIDVKGVRGALIAQAGSGEIKVEGTPTSAWKLQVGSGTIDLSTGSAPMTLEASTGSGTIKSDRPMTAETSADKHHITLKISGGGPEVRVESGSGEIHVH